LLVLIGYLLEQIKPLRRQLAWLNKQVFGRKSEKGQDGCGKESEPISASPTTLVDGIRVDSMVIGKRARGQQPGARGPGRKVPLDLPVEEIHHRLEQSQRTCGCCGKVRPEIGLVEESREIGWKVQLVVRKHLRHRYGRSCHCDQGGGIMTAPKPAKLIAKGLYAVDFWVEVLLKKFEFQQPLQRIIRELQAHGLAASAGSLSGGLEKMGELLGPLAGRLVRQAQQGSH
jgi:transposase